MTCANDRCRLPVVHDGRCDERVASADADDREASAPAATGLSTSAGASGAGSGGPEYARNLDHVGWYEFIKGAEATTHIAYVYEDGSVYLPEGPDVVDEADFRLLYGTSRCHRLIREDEVRHPSAGASSAGEGDAAAPPQPADDPPVDPTYEVVERALAACDIEARLDTRFFDSLREQGYAVREPLAPPQPADDLVQRAAEVIEEARNSAFARGLRYREFSEHLAQALVDAGWHDGPKLTDADRAVLEAAHEWFLRQDFATKGVLIKAISRRACALREAGR